MNDESPALHRRIRSFVRREGRLTKGQQRALDELLPVYGLAPDAPPDLADIFSDKSCITLEIGFGNGDTLLAMARAEPGTGFIGIEVHRPGVGRLLHEIERQGIDNVRVINDDAVEVLQKAIPDGSLDRVLVFFPDPWHKKRHHKRRLVNDSFVETVKRKLKPGGILHLATDWENYAEQMLEVVEKNPAFRNLAGAGEYSPRPDYRPLTKFEQRGIRLGHGVWDLLYERRQE